MEVEGRNESALFWRIHKNAMWTYIATAALMLFELSDRHWVGAVGWTMVLLWTFLYHQETYYFRKLLTCVRRSLKEKGLLNGENEEKNESDQ